MELEQIKVIHMVGIAGVSMSGIAFYLNKKGIHVTGSNEAYRNNVARMRAEGIKVNIGHHKDNLPQNVDLIIYHSGVPDTNPEIVEGKYRNIPLVKRAEFLGKLLKNEFTVGVMGAHGKTTTSGLIGHVLTSSDKDPNVFVGGEFDYYNYSNVRLGNSSDYNVLEVCEYDRSLENFFCDVIGFTNIDFNHPDCYESIDSVIDTYNKFLQSNFRNKLLVINKELESLIEKKDILKIVTVGFDSESDFYAKDISFNGSFTFYTLVTKEQEEIKIKLSLQGRHNILNSMISFVICRTLEVSNGKILEAFETFRNAKYRFESVGSTENNIKIYDDYAHVPMEINATLDGLKQLHPNEKIWVAFQPKQYHRTEKLMQEFIDCFKGLDLFNILVSEIEKGLGDECKNLKVNEKLKENLQKLDNVKYLGTLENITQHLLENAKANDIVITLGSSYEIRNLSRSLKEKFEVASRKEAIIFN